MSFTDLDEHLEEAFGASHGTHSLSEAIALGLRITRRKDDAEDLMLRRMAYRAGRPLAACRYCGTPVRRTDAEVCGLPRCRSRRAVDWARSLAGEAKASYLKRRRAWYDGRRHPCADCGGRRESRSPRCARCHVAHRRRLGALRARRHRRLRRRDA